MKRLRSCVERETRAIALMKDKQFEAACSVWRQLVDEQPDWEHGSAQYHLACCLEELRLLDDARRSYEAALKIDSRNPYFVGGFASFLYLHGNAEEAYRQYLNLVAVEKDSPASIEQSMPAIETLGARLGLMPKQIFDDVIRAKKADLR